MIITGDAAPFRLQLCVVLPNPSENSLSRLAKTCPARVCRPLLTGTTGGILLPIEDLEFFPCRHDQTHELLIAMECGHIFLAGSRLVSCLQPAPHSLLPHCRGECLIEIRIPANKQTLMREFVKKDFPQHG